MERLIVEHCAPTLANLKTAGLVNWRGEIDNEEFSLCRQNLKKKGVELIILSKRRGGALLYIYRQERLKADLSRPECAVILKKLGYENTRVNDCLRHLSERIDTCACFPHEIGLFLGYPPEDVKGFIENKGRNFKCLGYWKVYCNECEARKTFAKYKKCADIYMKVYGKGIGLDKLTVAA